MQRLKLGRNGKLCWLLNIVNQDKIRTVQIRLLLEPFHKELGDVVRIQVPDTATEVQGTVEVVGVQGLVVPVLNTQIKATGSLVQMPKVKTAMLELLPQMVRVEEIEEPSAEGILAEEEVAGHRVQEIGVCIATDVKQQTI